MSLNNIELNPQLLAGLYSKSLIGEADSLDVPITSSLPPKPQKQPAQKNSKPAVDKTSPSLTSSSPFKTLGNNQKNVLVGVNYADTKHLPDAQLDFLTNLLKACNLGLGDVAIINMNHYADLDYTEILNHFNSKVVMLFGITAQEFGFPFSIPEYQVQQFSGKTVIHSPALHEIENDKVAKGKLWVGVKRIFNL